MSQDVYEKEQIIAIALLCAITGENMFLLGPPGTAKSMVASWLKMVFKDGKSFDYLMSRFSTPDEIFGPISISRLKNEDNYKRLTSGYLPEADVVFLDEIWKADPFIFSKLLQQFRALQLEALKKLAMITQFIDASIEKKRMMWPQVCEAIESKYSKYEVNLAGYSAQFKSEDRDTVFSALTDDWRNACLAKLDKEERQILSKSKQNFESYCRDARTKDYEDKKKIDNYIHSYPQLKEIVDKISREKESSKEEKDSVIYNFLPVTVAKNNSLEEIDRVETGDNLECVIPVELSMPED